VSLKVVWSHSLSADVANIAEGHGVIAHSYANDTQLYAHCKIQNCAAKVRRLSACIAQLYEWMTSNQLKLNSDNTQFIRIGSRQQLVNITRTDCSERLPHSNIALRHVFRRWFRRWADVRDAREAGFSSLLLPAPPAIYLLIMSRFLSTLLLPVAWTTAIASCTKLRLSTYM